MTRRARSAPSSFKASSRVPSQVDSRSPNVRNVPEEAQASKTGKSASKRKTAFSRIARKKSKNTTSFRFRANPNPSRIPRRKSQRRRTTLCHCRTSTLLRLFVVVEGTCSPDPDSSKNESGSVANRLQPLHAPRDVDELVVTPRAGELGSERGAARAHLALARPVCCARRTARSWRPRGTSPPRPARRSRRARARRACDDRAGAAPWKQRPTRRR